MEAGKDLVPLLLSALALGSLLLWNFLIGRLAYWTGAEQYSSLGIAFVVAWHVALVLSLLSLSLLGWRLNSLRGVWIVCAVMAVLDAVLCLILELIGKVQNVDDLLFGEIEQF